MDYELLKKNLIKRGFTPGFFENIEDANNFILSLIPIEDSIGFGGSVTVKECGIAEKLKERGNLLFYREFCNNSIEKEEVLVKSHTADWYMCSTNALSITGELINIDGRANRVAEMLYGPTNIIVICGINKIVSGISEGVERIRNISAPKNCIRLKKNTPCAHTGKCSYCNSPDTICKATVIQHHPTTGKNVYIIIVNQNLGY